MTLAYVGCVLFGHAPLTHEDKSTVLMERSWPTAGQIAGQPATVLQVGSGVIAQGKEKKSGISNYYMLPPF